MQQAYEAIPGDWIVDYGGTDYVDPTYRERAVVKFYAALLEIGYARGWVVDTANN